MIAARLPGTRWTIAAALVLIALASAYYFTIEPSPTVSIRWRDGVSENQRAALERRFLLVNPTVHESRTWRYDLLDTSRVNMEALVDEPAIEDTGNIDPRTLAFPADYPYGSSWMWIAHRIPGLRTPGVVPIIAAICALVVVLGATGVVALSRRS